MKAKRSKQELQEAASLIEDITHDNIEKRMAAARKVGFIAEVLGGDRVKSELIPFLRKGSSEMRQKWSTMRPVSSWKCLRTSRCCAMSLEGVMLSKVCCHWSKMDLNTRKSGCATW